jgi:predicted RNA-binding Zn-ribbon protein involved in translation (DUF1610 family)
MAMRYPNCGSDNIDDQINCSKCGVDMKGLPKDNRIVFPCPYCGTENYDTATECKSCHNQVQSPFVYCTKCGTRNLARIDVMLNGWQTTLGSFVYKVFADNGAGVPDVSSALVTGMLVPRQDCQFTDVTFNGWFVADFTDISVNPGGVYYIWVNLPLGSPDWAANWKSWDSILDGNNIDYYPRGEAWNFVELVPHPYPAPQADFTFITYYSPVEEVAWAVEASPHTLNLKSNGNSIAVNVELPAGFGYSDVDASSIQLNGVPQASDSSPQIGDFDNDGLTDLAVKFPRQEVLLTLSVGDSMLVVTGTGSGIHFVGNCTVKVIG